MEGEPLGGGLASPAAPANLHEIDYGLMAAPQPPISWQLIPSLGQRYLHRQQRNEKSARKLASVPPISCSGFAQPSRQQCLSRKVFVPLG